MIEGLMLGFRHLVRITVFGTMGDDLLTETVGEVQTMVIRREFTRIGFEFFV